MGIGYLVTGLAPRVAWLLIARLLSGIAAAAYPTANGYIADVSPPEKRAANFGLTGAAFGVGFIVGPAIGGIVGDAFGPRMPFFVAAGGGAATPPFGAFRLGGTLSPSPRPPHLSRARQPPP